MHTYVYLKFIIFGWSLLKVAAAAETNLELDCNYKIFLGKNKVYNFNTHNV